MAEEKVILMWIPEGVAPKSGKTFDREHAERLGYERHKHSTLRSAIDQALQDRERKKSEKVSPAIKTSSGEGAAIFGIQEILVLDRNIPIR